MESTKKAVKNVMDEAEVSALRRTIHEGERKSVLSRFAERAIRKFGDGERAKLLFHKEAGRCQPPLPADVLAEIWNSAAATHNDRIKSQTENLPPAGSMKPDTVTDLGEAKVIAREYGDELRDSPATSPTSRPELLPSARSTSCAQRSASRSTHWRPTTPSPAGRE